MTTKEIANELEERINLQTQRAQDLADSLESLSGEEYDVPFILDALASVGYTLEPLVDHNTPSYAYMISLGMGMNTLLEQTVGYVA